MNEAELERLVVRLTGDGSQYKQMLDQAAAQTTAAAATVEAASSKIEGISTSIKGFASTAMQSLAALGAGSWLKSALSAYGEQASAERRLRTTLQVNGREVDALSERYKAFSETIQRTTTTSDEQALSMVSQAEAMGVTGDAAERATRNAIAAAAAYPEMFGSAQEALRATIALEQGNTMMLSRSMVQLRGISDEGQRAAMAQEILGRNFQFATQATQTLGGQIAQLRNAYGDLMEEFGEAVSMFVKPIKSTLVDMAREAVTWFRGMSREAKMAVVVVAGIITGLLALGPALTAIATVGGFIIGPIVAVGTAISGLGILIVPIIALVAAFGLAIYGVVESLGGIQATWGKIKEGAAVAWGYAKVLTQAFLAWVTPYWDSAMSWLSGTWGRIKEAVADAWEWAKIKIGAFWQWARPIVVAGIGYLGALWDITKRAAMVAWDFIASAAIKAWDIIKSVASSTWEFITGIWKSIVGDSEISWGEIKDTIVDVLIGAEFFLDNFGSVAEHVWTGIKIGFLSFTGEIDHFFSGTLPVFLRWFGDNWQGVFRTAFSYSQTIGNNLGMNLVRMFRNLPGLIAGTTQWNDIWVPLTRGAMNVIQGLPDVPERVMSQLEQRLRSEFREQGAALESDFAAFRERRLREIEGFEFGLPQAAAAAARQAENAGQQVGAGFAGAAAKEMKKFDAAVMGSAEALARLTEYREAIEGDHPAQGRGRRGGRGGGGAGAGAGAGGGGAGTREAVTRNSAEAQAQIGQQGNARMEQLLTTIANNTGQIASRPAIDIEEVSL